MSRFSLTFHLLAVAGAGLASPLQAQKHAPLRFADNGTFKVSLFHDLHFGEGENTHRGPQQDINSTRVMDAILGYEDQQLVVLNGDLISGDQTHLHNSTEYMDRIVKPLVSRNLPWASTYGNHDSNYNLSRDGLLAREKRWHQSLTRKDVNTTTSGVSNYFLEVFPSDSKHQVPELVLWFFDSRGGHRFQELDQQNQTIPIDQYVDQTVVDWFTQTKSTLRQKYKKDVPSLAFVHVPISAMLVYQQNNGVQGHYEPGMNNDSPLEPQGYGDGSDTPFMQALLDTPGMLALFSGHDHGDDWCFKWDTQLPGMNISGNGIDLCFGRHTGYGGYGKWTRGSRQILVTEKGLQEKSIESWIRLETGEISGKVTLNGTYGQDSYPLVNTTFSS